jgi:hypothetical protein
MSNPTDRVKIITSVQRRRRWTASEKVRAVTETPSQRMPNVCRHLKIFVQLIDPEGKWHVESSLR